MRGGKSGKKSSWDRFRQAGLLWWINVQLHLFGWAIVYSFDKDGKLEDVYPARVRFRGFDDNSTSEGYKNVSKYLADNAEELYKETLE